MTDEIVRLKRKVWALECDLTKKRKEIDSLRDMKERLLDEKKRLGRKYAALETQYGEILEAIAKKRRNVFRRLIGLGDTSTEREKQK